MIGVDSLSKDALASYMGAAPPGGDAVDGAGADAVVAVVDAHGVAVVHGEHENDETDIDDTPHALIHRTWP